MGDAGPAMRGRSVHDTAADRDRDRLRPIVGPELLEDPLQMRLYRVGGDAEVGRHLAGRGAVGHLLEDLALALGERGRAWFVAAGGARLLDERLRQLRMDDRVALDRVASGIDQGVGRGVLQQVPGHAGLDRLLYRAP